MRIKEPIKENTTRTRNMDMEYIAGELARDTKVNGSTENSMA